MGPEVSTVLGVFSGSSILLAFDQPHRVQDAIDAGDDVFTGNTLLSPFAPTDIIEDFWIFPPSGLTIEVPAGATHLFLGIADSQYWDNRAPGGISVTVTQEVIEVPVDIKPQSCPNPLNCQNRGVLPVAILGTADFDVTEIDVTTVQLEGVTPLRSSLEDVATPFEPLTGKVDCDLDCITTGPDGFLDLTLKFDTQAVVAAIGPVLDGECLVLELTGNLLEGTAIVGEDVVRILCK